MRKWIFWIVMLVLLAVFLVSAGMLITILRQYKVGEQFYEDAVTQFVRPADPLPEETLPAASSEDSQVEGIHISESRVTKEKLDLAPIRVDFAALKAINEEIVGWIYCENTIINYPILRADDNDYYLHRSYDRSYLFAGSIFMEAQNQPDFSDINTIIYGHNMKDNSMFATLENWDNQSYYDEHPIIWLLTPEQDYKIELLSGYTTTSTSDAYQLFGEYNADFEQYLADAIEQSDFRSNAVPNENGRFVLLSTCAYVFDNARYVVHCLMVPADSAGGVPVA